MGVRGGEPSTRIGSRGNEPVAPIEGDVCGARGLQIGRKALEVAGPYRLGEQGRPVAAALECRGHADERQIPMGLGRVPGRSSAPEARARPANGSRLRLVRRPAQGLLVRLGARRQPDRRARRNPRSAGRSPGDRRSRRRRRRPPESPRHSRPGPGRPNGRWDRPRRLGSGCSGSAGCCPGSPARWMSRPWSCLQWIGMDGPTPETRGSEP